jgi:hypothetical protein
MSDSTDLSGSSSINDIDSIEAPQDPRIVEYQETRKDLRRKADRNDRRFIKGVIIMAPILYYSFVHNRQLVVVIPWIIGFLFILGKQRWIDIDFLAKHCYDIEKEIDIDEFGWESKYGRFKIGNQRDIEKEIGALSIRLDTFPFYMGYTMGFITYVFFIYYSVFRLEFGLIGIEFSNLPIGGVENLAILIFYIVFSVILYLVWKFECDLREELLPDEEKNKTYNQS